ncbi:MULTISPECIES: hypothetical protein [unclassified Streptomyces]
MDLLLHRIGWSVQVPSGKATERATKGRSPPGSTSSGPS